MTDLAPGTTVRVASFVDWAAVFAGALAAAAISFVLYLFGSTIGLSVVSPWPNSSLSPAFIGALAAFWALASQIGSFLAGGYLAGRLRAAWEGSREEVEFRDGVHGLLVWSLGVVIGAILLVTTAAAVVRGGAEVGARVASAAAPAVSDIAAYYADVVLRPGTQAGAPGTAPPGDNAAVQGEVQRILARSIATGRLSDADRNYLYQVAARRSGLSPQEAQRRVDEALNEANRAVREAADKARKAGIVTGLVTGLGLMLSLAAAWWAAQKGGQHRDNNVYARLFTGVPTI